MINLLPPDVKENIVYARRNTHLRKWIIALFVSLVGIMSIVAVGHIYLGRSIESYEKLVAQGNQNLQLEKIDDTQKRIQTLTDNLKLVVQVLQREVLFSKLLSQVGGALPSGSILTDLSINKVQGGLDLQAATTDYQTATQVQLNLQDARNKIFEKADIISIQCPNSSAGTVDPLKKQYPCTVLVRALFAKNNSFSSLNINSAPGAKP